MTWSTSLGVLASLGRGKRGTSLGITNKVPEISFLSVLHAKSEKGSCGYVSHLAVPRPAGQVSVGPLICGRLVMASVNTIEILVVEYLLPMV